MTDHNATVRVGIVGPGEPGHRVFESNFVVECQCGLKRQVASTERRSADRVAADHDRTGR